MHYIESGLETRKYLVELKRSFTNPFLIFDERVCGIIIGPFFSVAYHSPYEWNRRITSECNRAWGYVKERDGETEVRVLLGKGLLSPFWLLFYTLISFCIFQIAMLRNGFLLDNTNDIFFVCGLCAIVSVLVCVISAVQSSLTDQGLAGQLELIRLLEKPEEYYG